MNERRNMKGQVNDGGPAYPSKEVIEGDPTGTVGDTIILHPGASLRAAAAMAALPSVIWLGCVPGSMLRSEKDAARIAVDYADALLEELDAD